MGMPRASDVPAFAGLLQDYFCQRLIAQRDASPATVASYRDTFRLLLAYALDRMRKKPTELALGDIDAPFVLGFLAHLERDRGNCPRTRNARFAAIRSFLQFAALKCPASLPSIQRVLAIPMKRFDRRVLGYLTREEVTAIIDAPDSATWTGRRDHVMLATFYNTGARVSEIRGACVADLSSDRHRCLRIHGKGRKERVVPLWPSTCRLLSSWLREMKSSSDAPIFPARGGGWLSRSGIEDRLASAVATAEGPCAGSIATCLVRSSTAGSWKRPRSRRFRYRTNPLRSQKRIFTLSFDLPTKTKRCPPYGSFFSALSTMARSPSMPLRMSTRVVAK
jgi:site-specific recombinase XerD